MSEPDEQIKIVPFTTDHLDEIIAIENRSFDEPWTPGMFRDALRFDCEGWAALLHGKLAGYIIVQSVIDELHILNVAVDTDFRGHGLAKTMLKHVFYAAEQGGIRNIYLEVRVTNTAAIALYKQFEFAIIARRKKYYPNGEDAHVMHRQLSIEPDAANPSSRKKGTGEWQ